MCSPINCQRYSLLISSNYFITNQCQQYKCILLTSLLEQDLNQMYIDSPNFPRRKVVNQVGQNDVFSYGLQRARLANFVADELNKNHEKDAQILQKFRRQAEDYKHNKLHKSRFNPTHPSQSEMHLRYPDPDVNISETNRIPSSGSIKIIDNFSGVQNSKSSRGEEKVVLREAGMLIDFDQRQLISQLKQKDKSLKKHQSMIKKNEKMMRKLHERVHRLERQQIEKQKEEIRTREKQSYQRLSGLVSSVADQILQNQSLLHNNISLLHQRSKNTVRNPEDQFGEQPLAQSKYFPPSKGSLLVHSKLNPKAIKSSMIGDFHDTQHLPTISYNKYMVKDVSNYNRNNLNGGLQNFIGGLAKSRNRLDALAAND